MVALTSPIMASPGMRASSGCRRSESSQSTSWLTRWRRISRRPWSASVVVCSPVGWLNGSANQASTSARWLGLLSFRVNSQSPPLSRISRAVSPWQCSASPVTSAPSRSSSPSSCRAAVISLSLVQGPWKLVGGPGRARRSPRAAGGAPPPRRGCRSRRPCEECSAVLAARSESIGSRPCVRRRGRSRTWSSRRRLGAWLPIRGRPACGCSARPCSRPLALGYR